MTPLQAECLLLIRRYMADARVRGAGWLQPSYVMAHCEIESAWDPNVASSDGLGSLGLMQVLPETAREMGVPGDQREPANSLLAGMRWLALCRLALLHYFAAEPAYSEIAAAFNEGPGNVERGIPDDEYVERWRRAQARWAAADAGAA